MSSRDEESDPKALQRKALVRLQNLRGFYVEGLAAALASGHRWPPLPELPPPTVSGEVTALDVLAFAATMTSEVASLMEDLLFWARDEGYTSQQIAEVLGLSEAEVEHRLRRVTKSEPRCLFCQRTGAEAKSLISVVSLFTPSRELCYDCLRLAGVVIRGKANPSQSTPRIELPGGGQCAFCSRGIADVGPLVGTADHCICNACLRRAETATRGSSPGSRLRLVRDEAT